MTSKDNNSLLIAITSQILLVMAAYLYLMGWVFEYSYLTHFGIPFSNIDIPFYYFFIYSYNVVTDWRAIIVIIVSIIMVYFFNLIYVKKWVTILILISLFPVFDYISRHIATDEAKRVRLGHEKKITLFFKKDSDKSYPSRFIKANTDGNLRIITQTKERYFILYQPPIDESINKDEIPRGFIYDIPKNDVLLAVIDIQNILK